MKIKKVEDNLVIKNDDGKIICDLTKARMRTLRRLDFEMCAVNIAKDIIDESMVGFLDDGIVPMVREIIMDVKKYDYIAQMVEEISNELSWDTPHYPDPDFIGSCIADLLLSKVLEINRWYETPVTISRLYSDVGLMVEYIHCRCGYFKST